MCVLSLPPRSLIFCMSTFKYVRQFKSSENFCIAFVPQNISNRISFHNTESNRDAERQQTGRIAWQQIGRSTHEHNRHENYHHNHHIFNAQTSQFELFVAKGAWIWEDCTLHDQKADWNTNENRVGRQHRCCRAFENVDCARRGHTDFTRRHTGTGNPWQCIVRIVQYRHRHSIDTTREVPRSATRQVSSKCGIDSADSIKLICSDWILPWKCLHSDSIANKSEFNEFVYRIVFKQI